jgi:hypothetical protein
MQEVVSGAKESLGRTYAEPLSGLRVSWGAVLAGTVAMLAGSLILVALALSVVSLVTHPTEGSLKGSAIGLWICGIAATVVSALVGGMFAGYLPGNSRAAIGVAHGFLAWAMALLLSFFFQVFVLRDLVATAATAILESAGSMMQTSGEVASSREQRAEKMLVAQGYTHDQAQRILQDEPGMPGTPRDETSPSPRSPRADSARAGRIALDMLAGAGWSWFGTWALACVLATAGGAIGARRIVRSDLRAARRPAKEAGPMPPLTPAPSP